MTGDAFKEAMERLGLSHGEIAKIFSVNPRTARRWTTGANAVPETIAAQVETMLREGGPTPEMIEQLGSSRAASQDQTNDVTEFLWVMRRDGEIRWIVAEHDRIADLYYLPGEPTKFIAEELHLGPVIAPPPTPAPAA